MITSNSEYLSNSLTYVYQPEIGQRIKYTANTGTASMTAANTNLNGSGTLYTVLQSGLANGTLIRTITIKGVVSTTRGMVRLFIKSGQTSNLIAEIEIPAIGQDAVQQTFAISMKVDFMLKYQWILLASTEKAENIIVTAEGLDISFP